MDKSDYFEVESTIEYQDYLNLAGAKCPAAISPLLISVWTSKCHLFRASLINQLSQLGFLKTKFDTPVKLSFA